MPHRSDSQANTTQVYKSRVRCYLRQHGEVVTKQALRVETDVPDWYIDQLAASDTFYTSLTHNGRYIASKHIVGRRADHQGFWRPKVGDTTVYVHTWERIREKQLTELRTRKRSNVETHLVLSVVAVVAAAFTAHRHDKPGLKHSLSRII